jgi:hypothetical protein
LDNLLHVFLAWVVRIAYLFALFGAIAYVPGFPGNKLEINKREIKERKQGVRRKGLQYYLVGGILCTLLLAFAELLNQLIGQPVDLEIFPIVITAPIGIVSLHTSLHKIEILALDMEVTHLSQYKTAFALMGIINLGMAVASYLAD